MPASACIHIYELKSKMDEQCFHFNIFANIFFNTIIALKKFKLAISNRNGSFQKRHYLFQNVDRKSIIFFQTYPRKMICNRTMYFLIYSFIKIFFFPKKSNAFFFFLNFARTSNNNIRQLKVFLKFK